jgi:DNA-binding transcriptional regulator YiaG
MANLTSVLKDEIRRLSRKEIKVQLEPSQKSSGKYRSEIAELKRRLTSMEREIKLLRKQLGGKPTVSSSAAEEFTGAKPRFSPAWVKKHRKKLGMSAADYGKLIGVSALTVYNWEKGDSSPRTKQLLAWDAIRTLGKREAAIKLEEMEK